MKIGEVTVDKSGRIVFPKSARQAANFAPGDSLDIFLEGTRVVLEPSTSSRGLRRDGDVLIFDGGEPFDSLVTLEEVREDRIQGLSTHAKNRKTESSK